MSGIDKGIDQTTANSVSSIPPLTGDDDEQYVPLPPSLSDPTLQDGDSTLYTYRDFGHVAEDDEDLNSEIPAPAQTNRGSTESSIRVQKFPVKLYAILALKEFQDIICWMPHGRSWKVLKPSMFESLVMPLFFEYSNYHSFNRLVNAWSFRRISSGPDRGSYYHELFLRGKPHLQKYMRRLPKTHKKLPMKKKDEPDFYKLDQSNPLPQIHEAPIPGAAAIVQAMRAGQNPGSPSLHTPYSPSSVVTPPHLSPNQQGPNIIAGQSGLMMGSPGMGGNMNGMGPGMGMGGLGNMHVMGGHGMPNGSRGLNPRYNNYDSRDEYDLQQPYMGRDGSFGSPGMGGQHSQMGMNSYDRNRSGSGYNSMPSNRRPVGQMRQGQGMDSMYDRSPPSPQNDFYRGFDQHPMMPLQHQGLYGRGGPSPSLQDDDYVGSPSRRQGTQV